MKNVMHVIDTRGPGGAESVYIALVDALPDEQFASFAVVSGSGYVCDKLQQTGAEITVIPSEGSYNINYLIRLIAFVKQHQIDIIQSHLFGSNVYCSLVGLICRIPVISTFHGFVDASSESRFNSLKFKIINRFSTYIVFVSNALKQQFIRQFSLSEKKCITIYNGIEEKTFQEACSKSNRIIFDEANNAFVVGSVGNIRVAKDYDILLKAAAITVKKCPQCKFLIAGQGNGELFENLKELKARLNLEEVVSFLGYCDNIPEFLANIDIFVSSSLSEGFSLSTVEAMACNLPVIVTKSGGPEEIISDGVSGLIVPTGNAEYLAEAIVKIIHSPQLRTTCIEGGKAALKKFSFSTTLKEYSSLYQRVLRGI